MPIRTVGPILSARAWAGALLLASCAWALAACSPTFNWREVRPPGTALLALMPCKPEVAERNVSLAGVQTLMHMHSCKAGGHTFAVAWADVDDAARVPEILTGWRAGSLAAIRVDPASAARAETEWSVQVSGAQRLRGLQATGQDPTGQATQLRGAYFSNGSQVFQAAVFGPTLPPEALTPFFEGLRLP